MWSSLVRPVSPIRLHSYLRPVSIKVQRTIIPILRLAFTRRLSGLAMNESGTQLPLYPIPPSTSSLHLVWLQEKSVKGAAAEIFIDLFFLGFIYFPVFPPAQTQEHRQRPEMSEAAENPQAESVI